MARLDHRRSRGRYGTRVGSMCVVIVALLVSGCSSPSSSLPEPTPPVDAIREDIDSVFGTLYGEDAVRAVLVQQHGELVYGQYQESTADDTWDVRGVTPVSYTHLTLPTKA